jgi:hypothetical protein
MVLPSSVELEIERTFGVFLPDRDFHAPVDEYRRPDGNGQFNVLDGEACINDRAGLSPTARK